MSDTLTKLTHTLNTGQSPIDIFGPLSPTTIEALKQRYRALLLIAHPDHNPGCVDVANAACQSLQKWYLSAQRQIEAQVYGHAPRICISSQGREYIGYAAPIDGELCDLFPAEEGDSYVLLKTARKQHDNDLLQAEARTLHRIDQELAGQRVRAHFPTLLEHVLISDASGMRRQVNVLCREEGTVSLTDVLHAYPLGIHPADAAWMFKRMLAAIATTHSLGLVHGAVIPSHMLIRPDDHNGILVGWCASVPIGTPLKLRSPLYARDYPPEVAARQAATPSTDIYLAASTMLRLLGGDPHRPSLPASVPHPIANMLRACLIPAPQRRPADAWQLFEDFDQILGELYGPPRFRPFSMPA